MSSPHIYPETDRQEHVRDDDGTCPCGPLVQPSVHDGALLGSVIVHRRFEEPHDQPE